MTYTYAILHVPAPVYDQIAALLKAAGYDRLFHDDRDEDGEVIDIRGIALARKQEETSDRPDPNN